MPGRRLWGGRCCCLATVLAVLLGSSNRTHDPMNVHGLSMYVLGRMVNIHELSRDDFLEAMTPWIHRKTRHKACKSAPKTEPESKTSTLVHVLVSNSMLKSFVKISAPTVSYMLTIC